MQTLTFLFAFIAVLALIGVAAWLVRRFANNRIGANTQRGPGRSEVVLDQTILGLLINGAAAFAAGN